MLQGNLNNIKFATRFSKRFFPENENPMIRYEKNFEAQYTAIAAGETSIILPELIGAERIVSIEKEFKPMFKVDYSFNNTNGQINLLNGYNLGEQESLFIIYAVLITA